MDDYRITITFRADRLTAGLLGWVVGLVSDPAAPRGLRFRIERVDDDPA